MFSRYAVAALVLALPVAALAQPTITSVANNYSYIPAGFPNSGIAPGAIFTIFGSKMSSAPANVTLQSSASPGIPKTLEGATLSVKVGATTVTPAMYYATPGQIAAVLPSSTPTGAATITVSYNGATSNAFSFQVVPHALGLDTYYGTGTGLITATNTTTGAVHTFTDSAKPGETIVLWGSGLGADTADSDTVFTTTPHAVNTPLQIYFGGVLGAIIYAGSSGYPGLDQIDVKIPANVPLSCNVGLVAVTGTDASLTASNFGSLAIAQSGGECTDAIFGISGTTLSTLSALTTVNSGGLEVGQIVQPTSATDNTPVTNNYAQAVFQTLPGSNFASTYGSQFSIGSCFLTQFTSTTLGAAIPGVSGLDAGNVNLEGPSGNYPVTEFSVGTYETLPLLPSNAITSSGGAFTFTGSAGTQVGKFAATVNIPNPILAWTNPAAGTTVNRSQGIETTWTGGAPGSFVSINGTSSDTTGANSSFVCLTDQSALQFTVPPYVLSALAAGPGTLEVENLTGFGSFTATGLDFADYYGFTAVMINTTYQ